MTFMPRLAPERYFYPRPPRGGRPGLPPSGQRLLQISIHALREEGDLSVAFWVFMALVFLSTPSARRATNRQRQKMMVLKFLSTPSARRATGNRLPS